MPVSERIRQQRQRAYDRRMAEAATKVPQGLYCYGTTGVVEEVYDDKGQVQLKHEMRRCPYWKQRKDKPDQLSGYCRLMKSGDWMSFDKGGTMLLWDQVKECGINPDDENDDDEI